MADNPNSADTARKSTGGQGQVSVRGIFSLTAAFALWLFVLADFRSEPIAVALFWTLAIIAGVGGHLIYTYLLPWRGAVVAGVFVISVAILTGLAILSGAGEGVIDIGDSVIDILAAPIELFMHQRWSDRLKYTIPVFTCIFVLAAAHPIKPGLLNAIITAIGISLWYGLAILIAANAG
ncbi:MAG: hypothetical protein ACR2N1_13855 [Rubripirellula sp.]